MEKQLYRNKGINSSVYFSDGPKPRQKREIRMEKCFFGMLVAYLTFLLSCSSNILFTQFCSQVFTAAAADEHKNIVLLAFETMEKIVREYFPYITETEAATFTDCVRCLIKFTKSRFNSDVSLNAIAFLRFCAFKLAEGGLVCTDKSSDDGSSVSTVIKDDSGVQSFTDIDDPGSYWGPLLTGDWLV